MCGDNSLKVDARVPEVKVSEHRDVLTSMQERTIQGSRILPLASCTDMIRA